MVDGKFINIAMQNRAALLLQFIVYGHTDMNEHEIGLNKILCGIDLTEPVLTEIEISKEETELVAELFAVLFERWSKVKNSTVPSFRASFLQREAVLEKRKMGGTYR